MPRLPPAIDRVVTRLALAFAPERIVLFGSRAKGTSHASSDVDLLIVADLGGNPAQHHLRARHIVASAFPPVDLVFCTTEDVERAGSARSPFLLAALETGVTIYRAGRPIQDAHSDTPARALMPPV